VSQVQVRAKDLKSQMGSMAAQSTNELPTASFVLSLIGGLLILAGVGMMITFSFGTPYYGMMGGYYGMMGGYYGMMQGFGYGGWFYGAAAIGLVSGIIVLIGAVMIYVRPSKAPTWGLLVLIFSIISLVGMGGFFLGVILGIVGGILGLTWHPQASLASSGGV
jgi:hypothetical protein